MALPVPLSHDQRALADSIVNLLRNDPASHVAYLTPITKDGLIQETGTRVRVYHVSLTNDGLPRTSDLAKAVAHRVLDYAGDRKKLESTCLQVLNGGSSADLVRQLDEVRSLFTITATTGEPGEVLLYWLAETILGFPQLSSKMKLKTSTNMHIHGADGVHAGCTSDGHLQLHWGQVKMNKNESQAVKDCLKDLSQYLCSKSGASAKRERDITLVREGLALADPSLLNAVKTYLNPTDPLYNKVEHCGIGLVGHDSQNYELEMKKITNDALTLRFENEQISRLKKYKDAVVDAGVASCTINIIHLPFSSVQEFRAEFLSVSGMA